MDIDDLYTADLHDEGAEMKVKTREGKETDMVLILMGADSKVFRKELLSMKREMAINPDCDIDEAKAKCLAAITKGWKNFNSKGKELKFSKKLVKNLYVKSPYIMDEVDIFINNNANFTRG